MHPLNGQCIKKESEKLWSTFLFSAPCVKLSRPANGYTSGDFGHGNQVTFVCYYGYQRIGAASSTCNDGTWSNSAPICKGNDIFSLAMHCHPSAVERSKAIKFYPFLDRQVYAAGQEFHQEYMYMETAFSMETKFSFHALQTTICLEVKEVDVLAGDGIQAYQNAKVGFRFLQLALWAYFSARTILSQPCFS